MIFYSGKYFLLFSACSVRSVQVGKNPEKQRKLEKPGGSGISTRSPLNNWNTNFVMRAIACVALRSKQFESENSDTISAVLSIPVSSSGKVRARTPFADNGFFLRNLSLKKCLMLG